MESGWGKLVPSAKERQVAHAMASDSDLFEVDEDSGITFAIAVYTDSIYIKTVYNAYGQGAFRVGEKQQILRYAEKMGFRTERFEKKRRSAHV